MKRLSFGRRMAAFGGGLILVALMAAVAVPLATAQPAASRSATTPITVTEHFNGQTFTLTPSDWHGATDCAIVTPSQAYCFNSDAQFAAFTRTPRAADGSASSAAAAPASTGVCNGWAKIWNGANWTGRGLAFEDYGYQQYLGDYVTVPFNVVSWFTDGQRGYSAMTNCWGEANDPGGITLHTNAESTNDGTHEVSYIELFSGTG